MLRLVVRAATSSRCQIPNILNHKLLENSPKFIQPLFRQYNNLTSSPNHGYLINQPPKLLQNAAILQISQNVRPLTKFSLQKGKRKAVKAVIKRFYRLNWGGWIRTKAGRHKKLWKKSSARRRRLRQHVLVNGTQSWLLDKMVTKYWRKPKYYVDDPYEPYHQREEFYITQKYPK